MIRFRVGLEIIYRGCVKIETPYNIVILSVAKDLGNTYFM